MIDLKLPNFDPAVIAAIAVLGGVIVSVAIILALRSILRSRLIVVVAAILSSGAVIATAAGALLPLLIVIGATLISLLLIMARQPELLDLMRTAIERSPSRYAVRDSDGQQLPGNSVTLIDSSPVSDVPALPAPAASTLSRRRRMKVIDPDVLKHWGF
jgi:hypothetical protein